MLVHFLTDNLVLIEVKNMDITLRRHPWVGSIVKVHWTPIPCNVLKRISFSKAIFQE